MPEEEEEMDLQDADVERGALDGLNMNETSELLVPAKCIAMRDMCAGVSSICLAGSCRRRTQAQDAGRAVCSEL